MGSVLGFVALFGDVCLMGLSLDFECVSCEGCDIVQSDHAPQAGVAQGIFDGELVRRRVGHQVELEEEQDKEVERRVRRDAQRTTHRCACMDDME